MHYYKKTLVLIFMTVISLMTFKLIAQAETTKNIDVAGTSVAVMIDPVAYESNNITFLDVNGQAVLYTPKWHYEKTNRSENVDEYVAIIQNSGKYEITHKHTSSQQIIPLDGLVLSVPQSLGLSFQVGDLIDVLANQVNTYDKAIVNQDGVRVPISAVNQSNASNRFVYYNQLYGNRTGTNTFNGNELIVKYSKTQDAFIVDKVNAGGDNHIPKDGFVIATTGSPTRFVFDPGNSFSVGDKIDLVNFDFIELEKTTTKSFTAVDVLRLAEYLVVYTGPKTSTGQNIHGFEAAVDANGIVVERDVLVTIPEGGFAISGHGGQHTFIYDNIQLGAKVEYNAATRLLTITHQLLEQTVFSVNVNKEVANQQVSDAYDGMYDVNDMEKAIENRDLIIDYSARLTSLKDDINQTNHVGKIIEFLEYKALVEPLFDQVYFDTLVSRRVETRGIWHRPSETTLASIEQTLDQLKSMNFTDVYLETFWNGYVIYKSELAPYHVRFTGANFGEHEDYLSAFIAEAKKRDIDVHAWVENFFVGVSWQHSSLWDDYADWRIQDINGNQSITGKPGGEEEGFLFFDPANPDARAFVMNVYKEIIEFDIVGLQLDYIRYPSGNEHVEHSTGYTDYAINAFKEQYGFEGDLQATVRTNASVYNQWNQFRQNVINTFVEEIHEEIRPLRRDMLLSIAVGPDANYAKINLMQDWRSWIENGWIDALKPMAYVNDVNTLTNIIVRSKDITNNIAYNYTGIAPTYFGLPHMFNAIYTNAININGLHGSAIFATHNLVNNQSVIDVFQQGTYKNQSISTSKSIAEIYDIFIEDMMVKFDNIYIKRGAATEAQRDLLETKLNGFKTQRLTNAKDLQELYSALDLLTLELVLYADGTARDRINEDIKYLMEIVDIRVSRELINHGYWDPTQLSTRPDANDFEYPDIDDDTEEPVEEEPNDDRSYVLLTSIGVSLVAIVGLVSYVLINKSKKNRKA